MSVLTIRSRRTRSGAVAAAKLKQDIGGGTFLLEPLEEGQTLAAEFDAVDGSLFFILDRLEAGRPRRFRLRPSQRPAVDPSRLRLEEQAGRLDVLLDSRLLLSYHFDPALPKPFINPLMGPHGASLLRPVPAGDPVAAGDPVPVPAAAPSGDAGAAGERDTRADHPWQRGITFMHGALGGVECWNEVPGEAFGRTRQESFDTRLTPVSASLRTRNTWLDAAGKSLLRDERMIRVYATGGWPAVIDLRLSLIAERERVQIGSTKEAGFLAVRMHPELSGRRGGMIENCYGARGEEECWGRPAHWVDYSGTVSGKTAGLAVFDHPDNLRYPSRWHVRDYGLFAPNVWYWGGPYTLEPGTNLTFRWRLVAHAGDAAAADVRGHFLDYEPGFQTEITEE